jgi:hypothetical protein
MTEDARKPEPAQDPTGDREISESAKQPWEPPKIEDVSEEVMAQPYIRFT